MFLNVADTNFKSLFCERFKCPPAEYDERVFGICLYFHARLLAPFVRLIKPSVFAEDFKFIHVLGMAADVEDARNDVANFKDSNRWMRSTLRRRFKIRVSGKRALNLACEVLGKKAEPVGTKA